MLREQWIRFFDEIVDYCEKGAVRKDCLCDMNRSFFCIFNFIEVEIGSVEVSVVSNVIFPFAFFYALFFGVNLIRVEVTVGVE